MKSLQYFLHQYSRFDTWFVDTLLQLGFTANLVQIPLSKLISEILVITFIVVFTYETIYWLGIYLGLWEYHAKDIFTEVPVHCAHVYIRLNVVDTKNARVVDEYYNIKRTTFSVLSWTTLNQMASDIFHFPKFVKYHFEFSPEDFEGNPEPEYGSTVSHLRAKVLSLFETSDVYGSLRTGKERVRVFNNRNEEVTSDNDASYLSKVGIETGNVIDVLIQT